MTFANFFVGLITDIIVRSKINKGRQKVKEAIERVEDMDHCNSILEQLFFFYERYNVFVMYSASFLQEPV